MLSVYFFRSYWYVTGSAFRLLLPREIFLLFSCIVLGKFFFTALATCFIRYSLKIAILVAAGLAHMGEFSFVIVRMGLEHI